MKVEFKVTYDTETEKIGIDPLSDNVDLRHSGSSYLRIRDLTKKVSDLNEYGVNDPVYTSIGTVGHAVHSGNASHRTLTIWFYGNDGR